MKIPTSSPRIPKKTAAGTSAKKNKLPVCGLFLPLGFTITDAHLRRSGMDYWKSLDVVHHADWDAFLAFPQRPTRLRLLTTKAGKCLWDADFRDGDGLVFGNEGHGAPAWLHEFVGKDFEINHRRRHRRLRSAAPNHARRITFPRESCAREKFVSMEKVRLS